MSRIVLDPQLKSRLNGLNEQVEVLDESGRPVGQFVPQQLYLELMRAWAATQFPDDEEKKQARAEMRQSAGLSTQEAIAFVDKLVAQVRAQS
jgi:hypothetical protein